MDALIIPDKEGFGTCAWCRRKIDEESPVYGFGIKFKSGFDLSEFEGKFVELTVLTQNKKVPMLITIEGSDAKEDGHDAMLMTCSEACGKKLKAIMQEEQFVGDMFEGINSLDD